MSEYKQYILRISYGTTSYERETMGIDAKSAIDAVERSVPYDPFFAVASTVDLFEDKKPIAHWDCAPHLDRRS